jgi:hypothetical protein
MFPGSNLMSVNENYTSGIQKQKKEAQYLGHGHALDGF